MKLTKFKSFIKKANMVGWTSSVTQTEMDLIFSEKWCIWFKNVVDLIEMRAALAQLGIFDTVCMAKGNVEMVMPSTENIENLTLLDRVKLTDTKLRTDDLHIYAYDMAGMVKYMYLPSNFMEVISETFEVDTEVYKTGEVITITAAGKPIALVSPEVVKHSPYLKKVVE